MAPFDREALPLSFDRVMEGRPIASPSSILFTVPVEILALILRYVALDKRVLAHLALVNSDCRQLARSCQFAALALQFEPRSVRVVGKLQKEAVQRMRSPHGLTFSPSLGACVRTLQSSMSGYSSQLEVLEPPDYTDEGRMQQWRVMGELMSDHMDELYIPAVMLVIPTLPHLESLRLDSCSLDDDLLDCLTMSKAKHLELSGWFWEYPRMRSGRRPPWPLETLRIHVNWGAGVYMNGPLTLDSSAFWQTFLGACASTLRELRLDQRDLAKFPGSVSLEGLKVMPVSFDLEFPNLKILLIHDMTALDHTALSCLLRADLSMLQVNYENATTKQVLSETGRIPTLETFILGGFSTSNSDPIRFVEMNTQITSFAVKYNQPDALLRRIIHSLIHHDDLKLLSLQWKDTEIPEESLKKLALLSQVEVLHLSAGCSTGYPHDWFVDHNTLKMYLGRLVNLKRLMITRDTYQLPLLEREFVNPERYYDHREPRFETLWAPHASQMLVYASEYVQMLPQLAFVHVGKINFAVKVVDGIRKPVVMSVAWGHGNAEYDLMESEFNLVRML